MAATHSAWLGMCAMVFMVSGLIVVALILLVFRERKPPNVPPPPLNFRVPATLTNQPAKRDLPLEITSEKIIAQAPAFEVRSFKRKLDYTKLSGFTQKPAGIDYSGPSLEQILDLPDAPYLEVVCHGVEGKPLHLPRKDVKDWIVAIRKGRDTLSSENKGPYFLINAQDPTNNLPRLTRIETVT